MGGRPDGGAAAEAGAADVGRSDSGVVRDASPPEPPTNPDPIPGVNAGAVTTLSAGDQDSSITHVVQISGGAGMVRGTQNCGNQGTCQIWKWKQPGAYLDFAVSAPKGGTHAFSLIYFAAQNGGVAELSLNGKSLGAVKLGASKEVGGYGGIPPSLSRGLGLGGPFATGVNRIRVTFPARSAPVDVYGIQVNYSGHTLPDFGKVNRVAASQTTSLVPETATDFYRMNYQPSSKAWPCQKSFCLVEYALDVEQAGAYEMTVRYLGAPSQCSSVDFSVDGKSQAALKVNPGSGTTPPKTVQLPLGTARLRLKNPNYFNGEFCGFGVVLGEVVLKPLP